MGKAIVNITPELFLLLQPQPGCTIEVVENDIPDDAKLVSISHDEQLYVCLTFESEKIPDVPVGQRLPQYHGPTFRRRNDVAMGDLTANESRRINGLPEIGPVNNQILADEPIIMERPCTPTN